MHLKAEVNVVGLSLERVVDTLLPTGGIPLASSARLPASGRVPVYCCVVMIWRWPSRSWTTMMSASPASSQEAWAARSIWCGSCSVTVRSRLWR